MSYSHNLTIRVPLAFEATARKISQALDIDSAGWNSWGVDGEHLVCSTPCDEKFYNDAQVLQANPTMLYQVVAADFATRWVGQEPPTLAEIEAFCVSIIKPKVENETTPQT